MCCQLAVCLSTGIQQQARLFQTIQWSWVWIFPLGKMLCAMVLWCQGIVLWPRNKLWSLSWSHIQTTHLESKPEASLEQAIIVQRAKWCWLMKQVSKTQVPHRHVEKDMAHNACRELYCGHLWIHYMVLWYPQAKSILLSKDIVPLPRMFCGVHVMTECYSVA